MPAYIPTFQRTGHKCDKCPNVLGFRCVCDWDKITQVKEIKDLAPKKEEKEKAEPG